MEQKPDRVAITIVGCFAVFALVVLGGAIGVLRWARGRTSSPGSEPTPVMTAPPSATVAPQVPSTPPEPPPEPSAVEAPTTWTTPPLASDEPKSPPSSEPHVGFSGDLEWEVPIEAADMTAVDVGELYAQARTVAVRLQSDAKFTGITAFETTHGKADLSGEGRVLYKFESVTLDPTQPAGKDSVERAIDVTAQRGKLRGARRNWPASKLEHFGGALQPPVCTGSQVWAVAVKSGVPEDAVAMLLYYDDTPFRAGGPWVWSVRVAGHDELRREIDGQTCAMVKSWGSPSAQTASAAAPPAGAASPATAASPAHGAAATGGDGCTLNMNAIPTSEVRLDGRPLGWTPRLAVPVTCGSHSVTFIHPEKGRKTIAVTAAPGRVATVAVKF